MSVTAITGTAAIPDDLADVDNDADTGEPTPDLSLDNRIACVIEIGAYEHNESCPGDADEDGLIDIDDLTAVVLLWGTCPAWPAPCSADFELDPCRNGLVDIDDMTAVILDWGSCSAQSSTYSPNSYSHFSFITTDRDSPPPPSTAASESSDDSSSENSSSDDSLSSSEAILQLLADGTMSPDQFTELVNAGLFP